MSLDHGRKSSVYRIEKMPDLHLLKALGFRKGTQFTIQSKQPLKGPIVVKVGKRCIAIDYDIARTIQIEEVV